MRVIAITAEDIWTALEDVMDPEIPVVSLVELGVVRDVQVDGYKVTVHMTPTFSGCPALEVMGGDVVERIRQLGTEDVTVEWIYDPPWSSNWIKPAARDRMKTIGLAPPAIHNGDFQIVLLEPVECPHCTSMNTSLKNSFGTTPCRMIYVCVDCREPFEQFKPL
ncbi:MAG: phenylacetate-CoA oxygenase subunit PaaJ [Chloroflexi bacterium]|nr:MAG: phenylacetate-CoA oxygenase subunit PaaJ [Chloroflexota bacterium]MBL1193589.1 phenylacetate-CoA oxygenase subunit PaaJ [Chloroflexota bacterium]NOH10880.1 phenylacetate-CoA oxygenase subunit PaaJ [Chloroflexota bacterium]